MIDAYYGSKEPNNINSYLMEYVQEVQILMQRGILISGNYKP